MSEHAKKFVKGAIILSIGGIIAKILSAFFRIPLTHLIGDTGLGYYQMPYPIYTLMIAVSYAGIPSTVSKIVSEKLVHKKYKEAHKIFQYTFLLLIIIGFLASSLMFFGADWLIKVQGWVPGSKYSLWGLALAPIFIGMMGAFRGYFQGMQDMFPTAVSQIVENFARVIFGLGAAYYFMQAGKGVALAAGGAAFGAAAGGIAGTAILAAIYFRKRKDLLEKISQSDEKDLKISFLSISKTIIYIAFPVSVGAAINSVMNWVDSALVVRRLIDAGATHLEAVDLFGQIGKASTFVNIPLTFSMALVVGIVPSIAEAIEKRNNRELHDKIELGTRFAILLGLPSAAGLAVLAQPVMSLIYGKFDSGADVLALMSISLIFIMLGQAFTGILQGMGQFYLPVINLFIAAIGKAIVNYILVAGPLAVNGAAIGSIVGYGIFSFLNYLSVKKHSGYKIDFSYVVLKPVISTLFMTATAFYFYKLFNHFTGNSISTLGAVGLGVLVYGGMLIVTGYLKEEDFKMIPKGDKLASILRKLKLLKN